jgi:Uma2 family endonuclease
MHEQLVPERIRLNYRDYCALPDNGQRHEILDGDLKVSPSPKPLHQAVVGRLFERLAGHVRERELGDVFVAPLDIVLSENDVVQPDLLYISRAQASIITANNIQGAPDLVVEVLSEANPELDTRDKRQVYARCGVPFYWMVDPWRQALTELQRVGRDYAEVVRCGPGGTFVPQLFPELSIEVDLLWKPRG